MATSSQADAQPLTTAGETQQAPGGSSQPVTLSDDAAKITEMVNDPRQVGSVWKAVKFLAGMRNSLAKLRKMRANRHLDSKEHDGNDTGKVGCCKVGFGEFPSCKRLKREQDKHFPLAHSAAPKESLGDKTHIY